MPEKALILNGVTSLVWVQPLDPSGSWQSEEQLSRRLGVLRRRRYYDRTQYDYDNLMKKAELFPGLSEGERAQTLLPEHQRKHSYSVQIEEGVNFLSDQIAGTLQFDITDEGFKAFTDALFSLSRMRHRWQEVTQELLIAGDTMARIKPHPDPDPLQPQATIEWWEAEEIEIDYAEDDWTEMIAVRYEQFMSEPSGVEGEFQEQRYIHEFRMRPWPTDTGEMVMEATESVYKDMEDPPISVRRLGLPFLPWVHLSGEKVSLRSMWGKSMISDNLMETADRYSSVCQLEYQAVRYNSYARAVVVGDAASLKLGDPESQIAGDIADVLTFPGGTDVTQLSLSTDKDLIQQQKDTLIDEMFSDMGLERIDSKTLENKGQMSGYALEILNRKCLAFDTEVTMADGSVKQAIEVEVGDFVVGMSGVPAAIKEVHLQPTQPVRVLETRRGRRLRVTGNHPIWTPTGWMDASEIAVRDSITVGLGLQWDGEQTMDVDSAWLVGLLVGDGYLPRHATRLSCADPAILGRANEVAASFGCELRHVGRYDYLFVRLEKTGPNLINKLMRDLGLEGKVSRTKRVPEQIMRGGPEVWAAFLSGYLDADGQARREPHRVISWSSVHEDLLRDVQKLCASLGINASLTSKQTTLNGKRYESKELWIRDLAGFLLAGSLLHPVGPKRKALIEPFDKRMPNTYALDEVIAAYWEPATRIVGLTVEGGVHWTDGLVTHNSDGTFRRITENMDDGVSAVLNMAADVHSYQLLADQVLVGEEEEIQVATAWWAVKDQVDRGGVFSESARVFEVRFGSAYIVDEVGNRDDFVAGLVSREEALRQKGYSDEKVGEVIAEIEASDEAKNEGLATALSQGTRISTERR